MARDVPRSPSTAWAPPGPRTEPLHARVQADVTVVGAGIVGLSAARMLAEQGASVVVLTADPIGDSVTGRSSAKVTAMHQLVYDELTTRHGSAAAATYALAATEAMGWLRERAGSSWEEADAVTVARDPHEEALLQAEAIAADAAGLDVHLEAAVRDWPGATAGLRLRGQGQVDPVQVLQQLHAKSPSAMTVHDQTRVTGLRHGPGRTTVVTADGRVESDHVVIATGLPVFDRAGAFALCEAQTSYVVALEHGGPGRAGDPGDMMIGAGSPTRSVRWGTADDGRRVVLVGGEGHRTGTGGITSDRYAALERWARQQYPDAGRMVARWSAEDFMSPDRLPIAGSLLPFGERVHMVTGLSKWGMTLGVAAASVVVQRILGAPASDFGRLVDPVRVPDLKAARTIVGSNAAVAKHMVSGWAGAVMHSAPADPAEGQGDVGRSLIGPRARCRVGGTVHDVSAVCPHLGGIVAFNDGDRTWDCPLHGSRFTHDGDVRHGPATSGLPGGTR